MIKYFFLVVCVIVLTWGNPGALSADTSIDTANPDKQIAFSFAPLELFFFGPTFQVEHTGFGAFGYYLSYQNYDVSLISHVLKTEYDLDLVGHTIAVGTKYYIEYDTDFYDTFYIAAELQYTYLGATGIDNRAETAEIRNFTFLFFGGRRFQWNTVFIDLSAAFGFTYTTKNLSEEYRQNYDESEIENEINSFAGISYTTRILFGVAF